MSAQDRKKKDGQNKDKKNKAMRDAVKASGPLPAAGCGELDLPVRHQEDKISCYNPVLDTPLGSKCSKVSTVRPYSSREFDDNANGAHV